jgi:microcompartment protein CcmK/EutM
MYLARVTKIITASETHPAYKAKRVFVVQPVLPDGSDTGSEQVAVDYVGSGIGDTVVCGGAPGVARDVFRLKLAPIRTLIMAIVEKIDIAAKGRSAGQSLIDD